MQNGITSERHPPPGSATLSTQYRGRFCPQCGSDVASADRYCAGCGAASSPSLEPATAAAVSPIETARRRLAAGDHLGAVADLEALRSTDPGHPLVHAYLGVAYLRAARVDEARAALDQAVALGPDSFSCHMAYAEFHARLGYFDRAVSSIDRALSAPMPSLEARQTALELRRVCSERTASLYYRQVVKPSWPRFLSWPRGRAQSPVLDPRSVTP